jgi:hypothetical protein
LATEAPLRHPDGECVHHSPGAARKLAAFLHHSSDRSASNPQAPFPGVSLLRSFYESVLECHCKAQP